ncbi:MAG: S1C family serine protease [Candidatus Zixiibacteriota bacterium]
MLPNVYGKAAGKYVLIAFWAVFFSSTVIAQEYSLTRFESGLSDLVYRLSTSIVAIESSYPAASVPGVDAQPGRETVYNVIATGIVYDTLGHILAVASSVANRPLIRILYEDKEVEATVEAVDYQSGLAMLKSSKPVGQPVRLSRELGCAGQMVVALGNAYGLRAAPSLGFCAGVRPDGVMQFTAPITSGTLGGGVFDLSGDLIGIVVGGMGQSGLDGMGLAVPAFEIHEVADVLINQGDRYAGYLGLTTAEIEIFPPLEIRGTNQLASSQSPDILIERGLVVTRVVPTSPAARAGLKKGDLLFSVNRLGMPSATLLASMVKQSAVGTEIEFGVLRQNHPYWITAKIGTTKTLSNALYSDDAERLPQSLRDSLLSEINVLKESIRLLEKRLEQLR